MQEAHIRSIFGLKLRQLREAKKFSLFGLSKKTGLSKSYLNEIEKGKKYPKTDKVLVLAKALEVEYDELVSLKLSGKMAPVAEMIQSGILEEIPLNLFGMEEQQLIDIMVSAPDKVNAFISTMFELARQHNVSRDKFFLAALRSYQELHHNYFKELELKAEATAQKYQLRNEGKLELPILEELLQDEFNYQIDRETLKGRDDLPAVRSVFVPGKRPKLLIDPATNEWQQIFLLAKELAFVELGITQRPATFTWIDFDHFEEVLNNFYASYFAGALVIPEQVLKADLQHFFQQPRWDPNLLQELLKKYTSSAETLFQRLTNVLPGHFGLDNLFFLRFESPTAEEEYHLSKELHLSRQHQPHATERDEHYCRRWLSLDILKNPDHYQQGEQALGVQISRYPRSKDEYLVFSVRQPDLFKSNYYRSLTIGLSLDKKLKRQVKFIQDSKIPVREVSVTCENCPIQDCQERAVPPTKLRLAQQQAYIKAEVTKLQESFS